MQRPVSENVPCALLQLHNAFLDCKPSAIDAGCEVSGHAGAGIDLRKVAVVAIEAVDVLVLPVFLELRSERILFIPAFVLRRRREIAAGMTATNAEAFHRARCVAILMERVVVVRIHVHRAILRHDVGRALYR